MKLRHRADSGIRFSQKLAHGGKGIHAWIFGNDRIRPERLPGERQRIHGVDRHGVDQGIEILVASGRGIVGIAQRHHRGDEIQRTGNDDRVVLQQGDVVERPNPERYPKLGIHLAILAQCPVVAPFGGLVLVSGGLPGRAEFGKGNTARVDRHPVRCDARGQDLVHLEGAKPQRVPNFRGERVRDQWIG